MYTYDLLETGCYYLVKEKEDSPVILIRVAVTTDHCLFVQRYDEPMETCWKLKKDPLFEKSFFAGVHYLVIQFYSFPSEIYLQNLWYFHE